MQGSHTSRRSIGRVAAVVLATAMALTVSVAPADAATKNITVCSQNGTYLYNILGTNTVNMRAKLDNPANFGPTGTYGDYAFDYADIGVGVTVQKLVDGSCDIYFSGYEDDTTYTPGDLAALQQWVSDDAAHQVVAGCDGSSNDPVCDLLGFTVTTDTDTYGFIADLAVNPVNCDETILPTDQINMAGGVGGYFSGSAVTAGNTVALHETGGVADPAKPIVVYTGNYFLTADINMIEDGGTEDTISAGGGVSNVNDRLLMNAFSGLADVASGLDLCQSVAPPSTTTTTTTTSSSSTTTTGSTTTTTEPDGSTPPAVPVSAAAAFTG